jgi:hypothetical protein
MKPFESKMQWFYCMGTLLTKPLSLEPLALFFETMGNLFSNSVRNAAKQCDFRYGAPQNFVT